MTVTRFDAGAFESYAYDAGAFEAVEPTDVVVTIGPSQPIGFRTIDDLNRLVLNPGDAVQVESIDQSGPFVTGTRLVVRPGVTYRSLDLGHKWGVKGAGLDLAAATGAIVEDYKGDGDNTAAAPGIRTIGTLASPSFTLRRYELCNYPAGAIASTHGQWADAVAGVTIGTGPDDSGWVVEDGYHHDNAPAGSGASDWLHYGKGLVFRRVTWRATGAGGHAFEPRGRGLRFFDSIFDSCVSPLAPRAADQLYFRAYFDHCSNPISSVPYDKTGLGGKQAFYGVSLRACTAVGSPLVFFDDANAEAGGLAQTANYDVVVYDLTALDSTTGAVLFDFKDFTIAGRSVKLRNVAHGKNVTAPFQSGYTAARLDSDYGAYPNGGKPAGETHSITPASLAVSEATLKPTGGSALLGAGTTTPDGTDYTPRTADIGFKGFPAPVSGGTPGDWFYEPAVAGFGSSAIPGGSFTPASTLVVDDQVVYALAINQNNLGDLVVTPPAGYTLRSSKSVTDRDAVYIATRPVQVGDTLTGAISLPTWLVQDSTGTNQARNYVTFVGVARGVDPAAPTPAGSSASGGNSTAQPTGATASTAIATPLAGALAFGVVAGKPGQTGTTQHSVSASSVPNPGWVKKAELLSGTATGAASISASVYQVELATASQVSLAVAFATNAQWAAAVLELAPAVSGSTDTTAPDVPANLQNVKQTAASVVVTFDPTDYGVVSGGGGGGGGGGPGEAFADVGPPSRWWRLSQDGGLRPSFDSYDPSAIFGPRARTYYDNASLRSVLRGSPLTGAGVTYYPRSKGFTVRTIDFTDTAHYKITLDVTPPASWAPGVQIIVSSAAPKAGSASQFKPKKPNGTFTIQSVSAKTVTFTTGAGTTSGVYLEGSAFAIAASEARSETIQSIDVNQSSIGSAVDSLGPLFKPFDPLAATSTRGTPANPWVLQPGSCNYLRIAGTKSAQDNGGLASLSVIIPPWFDVFNAGTDYLANGINADPTLLNPFCHIEFENVNLLVQDGMGAKGVTGGTPGKSVDYSEPLGTLALAVPIGEGIGWSGCSGVIRGLMNHDFAYDGNKFGQGAANLRWEYCTNFRNRLLVVSGGGHTDCYQVWDLANTGLGAFTDVDGRVWPLAPTWFRCYFEAGGNGMLFLNYGGGSGAGAIDDVWLLECVPGTGNKFLLAAGVTNTGARRCLVNGVPEGTGTPAMVGKRPDPLDFGSNDGDPPCSATNTDPTNPSGGKGGWHPCPQGTLAWPDPSGPNAADANLRVLADGSTQPIDRVVPDDCGGCFTYID